MRCIIATVVLAAVLACSVDAFDSYLSRVPNTANVMNNGVAHPAVGHVAVRGTGPRNQFGVDFLGASLMWTTALCQMDSDNDGQTNGFELGDPDCVWTVGATPNRTTDISHPGVATSTSTAAGAPTTAAPTTTVVGDATAGAAVAQVMVAVTACLSAIALML